MILAHTYSFILVILVNSIPILGFWLWNWTTEDLFRLFWIETVIIGLFNFLKMPFAHDDRKERQPKWAAMLMFLPIFVFLTGLTAGLATLGSKADSSYSGIFSRQYLDGLMEISPIIISIFGLHLGIFIKYLISKEYRQTSFKRLFIQPYLRIAFLFTFPLVLLMPAVLIYGLTGSFDWMNVWMLVVPFVIAKIVIDLYLRTYQIDYAK